MAVPLPPPDDELTGLLAFRQIPGRHIDYADVEQGVKRLAARLIHRYGAADLRQARYSAIPRGGLIVLGMLAYVLDLPLSALTPKDEAPLCVIVDDCSYSGYRFGDWLTSLAAPRVVFAHLFSHPELRRAIEAQEPTVEACIAADDLQDAPCRPDVTMASGSTRPSLQSRFTDRRYWVGLPELVVFPWSEPDRLVWNEGARRFEQAWHFTSPDRCLKNWASLGFEPVPAASPVLRVPDHVAYKIQEQQILLCHLASENVYGLSAVAADMWRAVAAYGDLDVAASALSKLYDVQESMLCQDLQSFCRELLHHGLLERRDVAQ